MQQMRLTQPSRRAQIDLDGARCSFGFQPSRLLRRREVAGERNLRGRFRHRPEGIAHDEFVVHQIEATHHSLGCVEYLGQPGARPVAHCRERVGESGAPNQVVR